MKNKAKEMFEKLGFKQTINSKIIAYEKFSQLIGHQRIEFDLFDKTIIADDTYKSMYIDIDTFKAINQQLKELGWLDE